MKESLKKKKVLLGSDKNVHVIQHLIEFCNGVRVRVRVSLG